MGEELRRRGTVEVPRSRDGARFPKPLPGGSQEARHDRPQFVGEEDGFLLSKVSNWFVSMTQHWKMHMGKRTCTAVGAWGAMMDIAWRQTPQEDE